MDKHGFSSCHNASSIINAFSSFMNLDWGKYNMIPSYNSLGMRNSLDIYNK